MNRFPRKGGGVLMETVKQTIRRVLAQGREAHVEQAHQSPRCHQVKQNGIRCGSPSMQGQPFCYFHDRMMNRMPASLFPPLEDGNSVQCAIMQVLEGLAGGSIEVKTANAMLYALQTAAANLRRVQFEPVRPITQMPMDIPAPVTRDRKPVVASQEEEPQSVRVASTNGNGNGARL